MQVPIKGGPCLGEQRLAHLKLVKIIDRDVTTRRLGIVLAWIRLERAPDWQATKKHLSAQLGAPGIRLTKSSELLRHAKSNWDPARFRLEQWCKPSRCRQ
jgi:hypothetical protein